MLPLHCCSEYNPKSLDPQTTRRQALNPETILKGSWNLVTRIINSVAVLIIIKNSLKVLMVVLAKSHDPPSKPPKTEFHPHLKSIVYSPRAYTRKHPQIP